MAASGHYLAAQAAFQIMEAGGNAVDAGVAGGLALAVLQSEFVSFGGVAPIMIRPPGGDVVTITGLGGWPKAASLDVFLNEHGGRIPNSILNTVVPAAPASWIMALEKFGTMSFGDVAGAAIRFAREGVPVNPLFSAVVESHVDGYSKWPQNAAIYLPEGRPPRPGELFVQEDLGRTIQFMADQEAAAKGNRASGLQAARDAFYRGDIAQTMVRFHKENGGWLAADDLADFQVELRPPVKAVFGDVDVYVCGPWCQGPVVAQTLELLNGFDIAAMGHNSPAAIHLTVEALKLAYADRHAYIGDPNFVDVPMDALMSADYIRERRALIRSEAAAPGMPDAGTPAQLGLPSRPEAAAEALEMVGPDALDTSYVCTVDSHGTLFSATPSDSSASGPVIPGLGFVPSTRGTQSWTDPSVPGCMAPLKRPRLTPNPAIAIRPGQWEMPFGSPGNDVQVQAMVQVLINLSVFGMQPQRAVEEPRFATVSFPRSSEPHAYTPGRLQVEGRIPDATREALAALGHEVVAWPDWEWRAGMIPRPASWKGLVIPAGRVACAGGDQRDACTARVFPEPLNKLRSACHALENMLSSMSDEVQVVAMSCMQHPLVETPHTHWRCRRSQ
jgi:gamma-glutamyltranspeptidase/glutathione hydrolase